MQHPGAADQIEDEEIVDTGQIPSAAVAIDIHVVFSRCTVPCARGCSLVSATQLATLRHAHCWLRPTSTQKPRGSMTKLKLHVITVSTRPNRQGSKVATWFIEQAQKHGKFDVRSVDLAEVALPMFDEPRHPSLGQYEHEHTRKWSASVNAADAFVFVTPEYNFSTPPSLLNALTFLSRVSGLPHGGPCQLRGVSAALRSAQMTKLTLTGSEMMPMVEQLRSVLFQADQGRRHFEPVAVQEKASVNMLDALLKWAEALQLCALPIAHSNKRYHARALRTSADHWSTRPCDHRNKCRPFLHRLIQSIARRLTPPWSPRAVLRCRSDRDLFVWASARPALLQVAVGRFEASK